MVVFNLLFTQHFWSLQTFNVNLTQVVTIVIVGIGMTLVVATGAVSIYPSVRFHGPRRRAIAPMLFMNIAGPLGIFLAFVSANSRAPPCSACSTAFS